MNTRPSRRPVDRPALAPWAASAACHGQPIDLWYPKVDTHRFVRQHDPYAAGRAICADCPVQAACLDHALASPEPHGMWGGHDPDERIRLTTRLRLTQPEPFDQSRTPRIQTIRLAGDTL